MEEVQARQSRDRGAFFSGIVVGGLVGAVLALLTAPTSGDQTRTRLRDAGEEALDQGLRLTEEARERAEAIIAEAQRKAQRMVEVARESVAAGKEEMQRFMAQEEHELRVSDKQPDLAES